MPLAVVGLSHRTAPVEVRERLVFGRADIPGALAKLRERAGLEEAAILSTCNRTEVYLTVHEMAAAEWAVRDLLAERLNSSPEQAGHYLYVHRDRYAVEHAFRVTSGLDSMILGEPQIQGQVREAYQVASHTSTLVGPAVGTVLNRLFQSALAIGGRVRSETGLGRGAASVSSAAVELAKKIFGSLQGRRALVLGAGEMSEVTLACLRAEGVRSCVVANRTYERATEMAQALGGRAVRWDELGTELPATDIVICSTAAPHPVLTRERLRQVLPQGSANPLCIIDIALPRDVDPRVGDEPNVFLYNIDDLQQIVDANIGRRQEELPRAEGIIVGGAEDFWSWYSSLAVVPTIRDLRARGEAVRTEELEKALRRLSHLADEDRAAVEALTRALLNKFLHVPTVRLREAAGNGRGTTVLDTVRYLFELDSDTSTPADADLRPTDEPDHL
jgi:glutamyl-tRNA reductase